MPTPRSTIIVDALQLYPVLSCGAPASGPQTSLSAEKTLTGEVQKHPNTVGGKPVWSKLV